MHANRKCVNHRWRRYLISISLKNAFLSLRIKIEIVEIMSRCIEDARTLITFYYTHFGLN